MKNKLFIFLLIFALILISGFGCQISDKATQEAMKPITLNYWRVWDGPDDFAEIIANYNQIHPNITIKYRKLRYDEYEQELIEAFATDRGPDIFSIHNTWTRKYQSKGLISPMPNSITMAYPVIKGKLKKQIISELQTTKSLTLNKLKTDFVDVVYDDAVIKVIDEKTGQTKEQIFGLPLFIDTLAMYYNKDLFNNAGITSPPLYWNREFQQDVKKLTKQNNKGQLEQSGVALGGSDNIERSSDILSILMMQNGAVMMDDNGIVKFHQRPETFQDKSYNPGLDALRFYADFSNPAKEVYSWNNTLKNSMDLFVRNKLAIMFGYAYMLPQILSNPKLNFEITKLPQIEGNPQNINFANYWVEVVSNKSQYIPEAWDFIQFITRAEQAKIYLDKTKKPTALRSLIEGQIDDQDISTFVEQVLTAKSWYKGNDANAAEAIMKEIVDKVVSGQDELDDIISVGARKVQQTVYKE